ncbi:MAG: Spy/CpxP family protein refolding chaperone [Candidatus Krumholzibacteriia bacterium]
MSERVFGMRQHLALALVFLLAGAGTAMAQSEATDDTGMMGPRFERMAEQLDLSAEQREELASLRERGRAAALQLRKDLLRLRHERHGEMMADEPDARRLNDLVERMGALRTELQKHHLEQQLAMRRILTDEQRDRMLLMRGRGGPGAGCGDGCGAVPGCGAFGRGGHGPGREAMGPDRCGGVRRSGPHGRQGAGRDGFVPQGRRSRADSVD